jgi:acetoin utilization deacetylase AcuC-like enzyme
MAHTGLVLSERYEHHDTGPHHPESAERARAIRLRMRESGLADAALLIDPRPADPSVIDPVHPPEYVSRLRHACEVRAGFIDTPECPVCDETYEIALLAVGGLLQAVDAVMEKRIRNAFCAVRPPGHHAERRRAMGFCYLNNIAIAAEYLRSHYGLARVAIVDFDVHHGNGTQHQFERDPNVFFCSIHQDPNTLYPGSGFDWERGQGDAVGTTLNIPVAAGSGDAEYKRAFEEVILPAVGDFTPEFVLVSAGFDGHRDDPLAYIQLSTACYHWMTYRLVELSGEVAQHRLVSTLEGGYDLDALADSTQAHVEALMTG